MDDLQEHQRRLEDEEFWEEKQRETSLNKNPRPRDFTQQPHDTPASMKSMPVHDAPRVDDRARAQDAPVFRDAAPASTPMKGEKKRSNMGMLYLVALLILGALAYQAYRAWTKSDATLPSADPTQAASALAEPMGSPALPAVLGALPAPEAPTAPGVGPVAVVVPDGPTQAQTALNERLDRLEARLSEVVEGLRAQGYIIGAAGSNGEPLSPDAFAPRVVAPITPVSVAPVRRAAARKRPKAVAKALPPVTRQQLLSVDMWDGRPSVVMGNGDASNPRVKVMQPGDSFNGITLDEVDVRGQRATFSDGARSVSLDVSN